MTTQEAPQNALLASQQPQSAGEYLGNYLRRVRSGDLGALPIILGLIVIGIIFQTQNANFLTPRNLAQLISQMAGLTILAYGLVFVLLLGEIDLSVGYVSAVAGVGVAIILRPPAQLSLDILGTTLIIQFSWLGAILLGVAVTTLIGLLQGFLISFFQLPSFIVTLAGLLAWNGVVLLIIGPGGTVVIQDQVITGLANARMTPEQGWIAAAVLVALYAVMQFSSVNTRRKQGLAYTPVPIVIAQLVVVGLVIAGVAWIGAQSDPRSGLPIGIPWVAIILIVLLFVLTFVAERTRFGRYVYAIGGNKEAARRAGIRVERIRIQVFMLCSALAGLGGIILASRLRSVATDAGGGNILLNAVAAAVIGGTSLFGGRGKVSSAVLGALVIAGVDNGMGLLSLSAGHKFIVTGIVLLVAVIVDALSRRSQQHSGLA
ncbi:MAG: ABC transporter permease [Anaerolineae bacterium]